MENEYKRMMEKITLSPEASAQIEKALKGKTVRQNSLHKPLRVAVAFSCAVFLLVGCAVIAAEYFKAPEITDETIGEGASSFAVTADVNLFDLASDLPKVNEAIQKEALPTSFDSKEELESYLGIALVDWPALEQCGIVETLEKSFEYGFYLYPALRTDPNARYVLTLWDKNGQICRSSPHRITVTSHRVYENMEVYVQAAIYTNAFDLSKLEQGILTEYFPPTSYIISTLVPDGKGGFRYDTEYCYDALYDFTTETYQMKNGNSALIVTAEKYLGDDTPAKDYMAYFVQDGILYTVRPWGIFDPQIEDSYSGQRSLSILYKLLDRVE